MGQAWEEESTDRELVTRSFKKCGISVAVDGTDNVQICIEGLDNYSVEDSEDKLTNKDPFNDYEL